MGADCDEVLLGRDELQCDSTNRKSAARRPDFARILRRGTGDGRLRQLDVAALRAVR